ncbi:hypothetical protein M1L60_33805 [Actinoplanes sp. TRM 88003]|uniref:Kojibiose phosphorylase n=1 Tax=Paractinoplanes aksuensis TaxID=2939490 RepID=A0ABT1DXS1_9ACTN|nr:glycosyl hydrolase family 65 protein [Actinoplanes aksuensis]MCO8275572.1 hypothetical protein [Actinoplanes aksuensis]
MKARQITIVCTAVSAVLETPAATGGKQGRRGRSSPRSRAGDADQAAKHVDGVTGPDEYSGVTDDNLFTNLMAARNLCSAVAACARRPAQAARLGVRPEETESWQAAADAAHIPYDDRLGVHQQSTGFTRYAPWDFAPEHPGEPLMLRAPYFQLCRRQVIKQVDLVLAMHWCPEEFTDEQKACNVDYYERITVRASSLSACTQAVMCAETGHLELAHDYASEAALRDLHANAGHGLHLASLAGAWSAIVEGFGGLREQGSVLALAPRLPEGITGLRFRLRRRGLRLLVEAGHETVRVTLLDDTETWLSLRLYDETGELASGEPVHRTVVPFKPLLAAPRQPPGYAPQRATAGPA